MGAFTAHDKFEVSLRVPSFATVESLTITINFTHPLHQGSNPIHMSLLLLCIRPPCLPVLTIVMYNIWDSRGFGLLQAIQATHMGNYDLMILM